MTRLIFVCIAVAFPAWAQPFQCQGETPDWTLSIDDNLAQLVFPAVTDMEVKLITMAEGQDWPRAFTLIGERDTAIALIEQETCGEAPYRAHIMTQRGQTPVLLSGCCHAVQ